MNSEILKRKPIIKKDDEEIIDLTAQSIRYIDMEPVIIDSFYVGDDMVMRPDLISYAGYNSVDHFDLILKFNAISNPFAIDKNTYILVPDLKYMYECLTNPKQTDIGKEIRDQYIDEKKEPKIDSKRLEFHKAIAELRKKTRGVDFAEFNLPPNISMPGEGEAKDITNDRKVKL